MRRATKGLTPFEVTLREVTGHIEEYLFLNVKRGADQLVALHDQLYSGVLSPPILRRSIRSRRI